MKSSRVFAFLAGINSLTAQSYPDSSNLPLVIIDTDGRSIPDDPKIDAWMKIVDHGPGRMNRPADAEVSYNGRIGIEVGGASSSSYLQKPYEIETRDASGDNRNVSLLGMPSENDWVLTSNYNEKSFVRNSLAFDLFRRMGHYAPRAKLCEAIVNSKYRGVYLLSETIKRDKNRVDISKLDWDENAGDNLTGGYIIKVDYHDPSNSWLSDFRPIGHPDFRIYFVYYYPKADTITRQQKAYIQNHFKRMEGALYGDGFRDPLSGYRRSMDVASLIDYFIISEVSRNVDGYKKSRYLSKDRDSSGGLLQSGPPWDFDWAWKNIRECIYSAADGSGWSYKTNDCPPDNKEPGWYVRLLQDAYFTNRLIDRYFELREGVLDTTAIWNYVDSVKTYVSEAQKRHFALWPIDKDYRAPEVDSPSKSYDEELNKLKIWIRLRIRWLDRNIQELRNEIIPEILVIPVDSTRQATGGFFPNPASDRLSFLFDLPVEKVTCFDVLGRRALASGYHDVLSGQVYIGALPPGMYIIRVLQRNGITFARKQLILR
jgi:hypothetical protein